MSFENLGLAPALLRALADSGYTKPTPVQTEAIPLVLAGRDLLAGAQTGTGKTAAFALPLLERLFPAGQRQSRAPGKIRALVLTPTRELAAQVHDSVRTYGRHVQPSTAAVFGGVGMHPQTQLLRRGVDVLVATPGRLIDHLERRHADLSGVEIVVLDEADRMLDMGFLPALKRILAALPKVRQTLMFSATFANEIKSLAQQFLRDPAEVQIAGRNSAAVTVTHRAHPVDSGRKRELLVHLLSDTRRQALVFSRTKHGADRLARQLGESGLNATAIHGNKSQGQRTKALRDFKLGKVGVLVATDIAARGLDIQELPMVVNYDLPMVAEDYVHRIGRTGRAGADGLALSLVAREDVSLLRGIERLLNRTLALEPVAGFEPMGNFQAVSREVRPPQKFGNKPKPQHARRPHHGAQPAHHAAGNKKRRPAMQWQSRGSR
jgi:ATP-dependent RNA helicase RhlE